jgi:hypothetical protein
LSAETQPKSRQKQRKIGRMSAPVASGPNGLQFCLLGRVEAYRHGFEVDLGHRKQRAVLALLLLNANRVVPTDRLIDDLWGESPPSTARSALQVYVAGLRKALANDGAALLTRAPGSSTRRSTSGVTRRSQIYETSPSSPPRSLRWGSSGWARSRRGSTPTSPSAGTPHSSRSSMPWSQRTLTANDCALS